MKNIMYERPYTIEEIKKNYPDKVGILSKNYARMGKSMNSKFLYNNKVLKDRRKELRNNSTETEAILWDHLKHSKLGGFKFVRQYSVGPYILDFFCPKLRIAVELDGNQHGEANTVLYDKDREDYLNSANIRTIRFWNDEIKKDMEKVVGQIYNQIIELAEPPLKIRGGRGCYV